MCAINEVSDRQVYIFSLERRKEMFINGFKSGGQKKSSKILISWQELKNRFLSLLVHG